MRCKLLLQHYARYQEQPTAQVREVCGGTIATSAELVKGVTLKKGNYAKYRELRHRIV